MKVVDLMDRQCTATSKQSGNRCRNTAIAGGNVCRHHGGGAPQVESAARRRLLELVAPALVALADIVEDTDDQPTRLRAARDILDRVGLREPDRLEVITVDVIEAEIARLEAELGVSS